MGIHDHTGEAQAAAQRRLVDRTFDYDAYDHWALDRPVGPRPLSWPQPRRRRHLWRRLRRLWNDFLRGLQGR